MDNKAYRTEIKTDNKTGEKYIELKGLESESDEKVSFLDIPENITDEATGEILTVRVIGNHAFSSRKDITEVRIPDSVHTILGFAFHNCGKLRKITLTDSVVEYLDGGTRQCESLKEIEVDVQRDNFRIIRRILEDNDRRLSFRLNLNDGEALLVFPGFVYDFVENTMARTIQFAIEGTGYAYRECVKPDQINLREYDNLFSKAAADDRITAEMIAVSRISYPYVLSEDAEKMYLDWLFENAVLNLTDTIREASDAEERIDFYRKRKLIPKDDVAELVRVAMESEKTAIVSVLMEYKREVSGDDADDLSLSLDF